MTSISSKVAWLLRSETLKHVQRAFLLAAVCAITVLVYRYRFQAADLVRTADLSLIAMGAIVLVVLHALVAAAFNCLHRALDVRRRLADTMASYFARLPARYLPGGVWHTVTRYIDIHAQQKVDKRTFGVLFLAETGTVAVSGLLIGSALGQFFITGSDLVTRVTQIMLAAGVVLAVVLWFAAARAGVRPRVTAFVVAVLAFGLNWIGLGIAFALYAHALHGGAFAMCGSAILASTYDIAASLGYVTIFAPQGWGITELSFGTLQTCGAKLPETVTALAGFRIVILIADVLAFSLGLALATVSARMRRRHPSSLDRS